jgi:chromosome segregation ATPase
MKNEPEKKNEVEFPENKPERPEQKRKVPEQEMESARATISGLEQALAGKDSEIGALHKSLDEVKGTTLELTKRLSQAVTAYREIVVKANPAVLAEMIAGDSIDGINESLINARAIMEKARREIEADAARAKVPAGAPQRTPPDMSALSAHEKIQFGLGR